MTRRMFRRAAIFGIAIALAACGNRVDFDAHVERPAFRDGNGPLVLFDHGHHNHHEMNGTYRPFADLMKNDGFRLQATDGPFTPSLLGAAKILVIVAAQSQSDTNAEPALSPAEVRSVVDWVSRGGSLLLITDHYPFPNAVETLANALGLEVAKGMTFDAQHDRAASNDDSRLIFSKANGLLADHPITHGRDSSEAVSVVETFTGDAFLPRDRNDELLRLAPTAQMRIGVPKVTKTGSDTSVTVEFVNPRSGDGWAQGVALPFGKGRVVALAEAAMLSAQEDGGKKFGMNAPGNDNRKFALNAMHWLARLL